MMEYAYVTTNLLDLWSDPAFNSERANQLSFGEVLQVRSLTRGFAQVVESDGYTGWTDERFLREISQEQYIRGMKSLNGFISDGPADVFAADTNERVSPYFLFYGTHLHLTSNSDGFITVELPDGAIVRIKSDKSILHDDRLGQKVTGEMVVNEAMTFLGVPYLWGGITPAGFDCSGFVRTLYGAFCRYLPRDTKDQIVMGKEIARWNIQTGDLLFFDRHVGLAIGKEQIIHCSMGGGGVRINSLSPSGEDYRPDLDRDFRTARRVL